MTIQWNEFFETGFVEFDDSTQELFRRVNSFVQALIDEKPQSEIDRLFKFVDDFIMLHFANEEKLLQHNSYPDIAVHKAQHAYFMRTFRTCKVNYDHRGVTEQLIKDVHRNIVGWLTNHVSKTDQSWAKYTKEKNKERFKRFPEDYSRRA